MKNTAIRKGLSSLLLVTMLFLLVPLGPAVLDTQAAEGDVFMEGKAYAGWNYQLVKNGDDVYKEGDGLGLTLKILLPENGDTAITNDSWTKFYLPWFPYTYGNSSVQDRITRAELPDGVTEGPNIMTEGCKNLRAITLPDSLEILGGFMECTSLTSITVPSSVKTVRNCCFEFCSSLTEVNLPEGLESIEGGAFCDCTSLKDLTIPSTVNKIVYAAPTVNSRAIAFGTADDPSRNLDITLHVYPGSFGEYYVQNFRDDFGNALAYEEAGKVSVDSVILDAAELTMVPGQTVQLQAQVLPADAWVKDLTWSSSAPETVRVTEDGTLTALKSGSAVITAVSIDDNTKQASCTVTVEKETEGMIHATGITVSPDSLTLLIGESSRLSAAITPENATSKTAAWESSDPSVATVDADGQVTGVSEGTAVITASSMTDAEVTASVAVSVWEPMPYTDVHEGQWFYGVVEYAFRYKNSSGARLMSGYEGGLLFGPNDPVSRGQFATILCRYEDTEEVPFDGQFPDIQGTEFYAKSAAWAYENGVIMGYGDGRFGGGDPVTREQIATILFRFANEKGADVSESGDLSVFADQEKVSPFADAAIHWAVGAGIIKGKEYPETNTREIDPQGVASRAECAAMFQRFIEKYKN